MANNKIQCDTKENKTELTFSVTFQKDGESFQEIMEKILTKKLTNNL